MKTDSHITVRPLNPDNEIEIQHLVALFERCNRSGILSPAVLSARYWKGAAGRRFSSLIALGEGKILAHCGFGIEKNSPTLATLSHVMVDPTAAENLPEIVEGFEQLLAAQMLRKGLTSMVALRHSEGCSEVEEFLRNLHMVPVAQLPDDTRSVELWTRLFERGVRSLQFVPATLRGAVASAYRSLGIRTVARGSTEDAQVALSADDVAMEPFPVSRTGKAFLFVTPTLLMQHSREGWIPEPLEKALTRWPKGIVAVKLADPKCTELSQLIQSQGFSYLGILPGFSGWDNILFARAGAELESREPAGLSRRSHRVIS